MNKVGYVITKVTSLFTFSEDKRIARAYTHTHTHTHTHARMHARTHALMHAHVDILHLLDGPHKCRLHVMLAHAWWSGQGLNVIVIHDIATTCITKSSVRCFVLTCTLCGVAKLPHEHFHPMALI